MPVRLALTYLPMLLLLLRLPNAGCAPDVVLALRDMKGNTLCRLKAVKAILAAWSPVLRGAIELGCNSSTQDQHALSALHASSSSGCLTSYGSSNCTVIPTAATSSPVAGIGSSSDCNTATGGSSSSGPTIPTTQTASSSSSSSWGGLELPILVDGHKEVEAWKVAVCLMHPLDPTCGKTPSSLITTCVIKPLVTLADKYNLQVGLLGYLLSSSNGLLVLLYIGRSSVLVLDCWAPAAMIATFWTPEPAAVHVPCI